MSVTEYSPAFKIFHFWWYIIVPQSAMYNVNDYEYFGIPTTGQRDWDLALANEKHQRAVTIAEMAQLVTDGVPLTLNDPNDAAKIYKLIGEHLTDWRDALVSRLKPPKPPLEGLYELNKLAGLLMPVARGNGLVAAYKRPERYNSRRMFSDVEEPKLNLSRLEHSSQIFDEILNAAKAAGYSIRRYQSELVTSPNTGSI